MYQKQNKRNGRKSEVNTSGSFTATTTRRTQRPAKNKIPLVPKPPSSLQFLSNRFFPVLEIKI
jgi:hypothetical protein